MIAATTNASSAVLSAKQSFASSPNKAYNVSTVMKVMNFEDSQTARDRARSCSRTRSLFVVGAALDWRRSSLNVSRSLQIFDERRRASAFWLLRVSVARIMMRDEPPGAVCVEKWGRAAFVPRAGWFVLSGPRALRRRCGGQPCAPIARRLPDHMYLVASPPRTVVREGVLGLSRPRDGCGRLFCA